MHSVIWSDLQFVLAVSRSGSLSAAARDLGVNHATVLRRVRAFEARHGLTLFDRAPGGYRAAPDHAPILSDLDEIGTLIKRFERRLAGQGEVFEGSIRLTTTDTLAQTVVPRLLAGFRQAFPRMSLQVSVTNAHVDLARLDADITLRPAQSLPDGLSGRRVADLGFRVYGPMDADVSMTLPWIGPSEHIERSPLGAWCEANVPPSAIAFRMNSFAAMRDAAAHGAGLALLPCCLGDPDPNLQRWPGMEVALKTGVWIAAHEDLIGSTRVDAVITHLAAALAEDRDRLSGDLKEPADLHPD